MEAVDRRDFPLGARVRFKDGAVGRLRGLEVGTEPSRALGAMGSACGLLAPGPSSSVHTIALLLGPTFSTARSSSTLAKARCSVRRSI